jgi:hypothetical protein
MLHTRLPLVGARSNQLAVGVEQKARKPRIAEQHEKNRSKHNTIKRRVKLVLIKNSHNLHQQRNKSLTRFKRANSNSPCWRCTRSNRWLFYLAMLKYALADSDCPGNIVWMHFCCWMRFGTIGSGTCTTNCCNNKDKKFKSCRACSQERSEEKSVPANCSPLATAGKTRIADFSWLDCPLSKAPVRKDCGNLNIT